MDIEEFINFTDSDIQDESYRHCRKIRHSINSRRHKIIDSVQEHRSSKQRSKAEYSLNKLLRERKKLYRKMKKLRKKYESRNLSQERQKEPIQNSSKIL